MSEEELPDPVELFRRMQQGEQQSELPDPAELFRAMVAAEQEQESSSAPAVLAAEEELPDPLALFEQMQSESRQEPLDDLRLPLPGESGPEIRTPLAPAPTPILPKTPAPEESRSFLGRLKKKFQKSQEESEPIGLPPLPGAGEFAQEAIPTPEEMFEELAREQAELKARELPALPDLEEFKRVLEEEKRANLDPDLEHELSGPERFVPTVSDSMFATESALPSFFDEYDDEPVLKPGDISSMLGTTSPQGLPAPVPPVSAPNPEASKHLEDKPPVDKPPVNKPRTEPAPAWERPAKQPFRPAPIPEPEPDDEPEELSVTGAQGPTGTVRVDPLIASRASSSPSTDLYASRDPARVYRPAKRPASGNAIGPPPTNEDGKSDPSAAKRKPKLKRFSRYQLAVLTRQLSVMLKSGIQLHSTIAFAAEADPQMRPLLDQVLERVESGYSFSNAITSVSRYFDPVYVGLVQAGEHSGRLPEMLSRLADVLEREVEMRKRIISTITYPLMLLIVCFLGTLGFVFFILPTLEPLFNDLGVPLPMTTRILLASRHLIIPGVSSAAVIGFLLWFNWDRIIDYVRDRPYLERRLAAIPFRIPVLGNVYDKVVTSRVMYSLSTMLDVGITLNQALARSETTAGNALVAYRLGKARFDLADGMGVTECFAVNELFSPSALYLISAGEEAAKLANMFQYVAKLFDEEVGYALETATALLEPMIMVVMGLVVGFIVVSAAAPTIQLLQSFS